MYNKHVQIARNIMQNIQNGNKTFNEQEDMRWPEASPLILNIHQG